MRPVFPSPQGDAFVFFDASAEVFNLTAPLATDATPALGSVSGFVPAVHADDAQGDAAPESAAPPDPFAPAAPDWRDVAADVADPGPAPDDAAEAAVDAMARPKNAPTKAVVAARAAAADAGGFTGDGKAIVVIDTGWSSSYDQSNTTFSFDFSGGNDADASVSTLYSHGSWVAQTVTGVSAGVDIIHLKVFDDSGSGANFADIEEALRWTVANVANYDIAAVNLSLGYGNALKATKTTLSDEFAALDKLGVFNIVAAGNSGDQYRNGVNVLAADPNVIAVSATDAAHRYTSWTQKHATLTDISALGANVEIETVDGLRGWVSGTSFAAPYVAGVAARLQEATEEIFGLGARLDENEFLGILRASGDRVVGATKSWKGAVDADADAAVDWFLDHAAAYASSVWV